MTQDKLRFLNLMYKESDKLISLYSDDFISDFALAKARKYFILDDSTTACSACIHRIR